MEQVEQIVWQYKLAPETINLPAKPGVPEVQIFRIVLKTGDMSVDVLKCIDGAVQFAPACVPFHARAFLRGGMMACALRSAIAAWHALVS